MKPPKTLGLTFTPEAIHRHLEIVSKVLSNVSFGTVIDSTVVGTTANAYTQDRNITNYKISGTTPATPNTAFTLNHYLKTIPIGFHVIQLGAAAHIYGTPTLATAWSATTNSAAGTITLFCDTASVAFAIMVY